jgi:hypothetical protein
MLASSHRSAATLGRLAFRLTIVLILSTLWSGDSPAQAASVLSLLFAAAVFWTAYATGESPTGPGLNRWHEGAFLAVLGLVLFFWFGRDSTSGYERDRRNRAAALAIHGYSCKACNSDLSSIYGTAAAGLIEVHHLTPRFQARGAASCTRLPNGIGSRSARGIVRALANTKHPIPLQLVLYAIQDAPRS